MITMKKNKKGWIRIVEAFVAILLIAGVLLTLINQGYIAGKNPAEKIYSFQLYTLREIELNDDLRNIILNIPNKNLSLESDNSNFPPEIKNLIYSRMPNYLECKSKICPAEEICSLEKYVEKNVYAQAVIISANLTLYAPRQIKIFCWVR